MTEVLNGISNVDIDIGKFKYVLIKVHYSPSSQEISKFIVRGYSWAAYHGDIYDKVAAEIESKEDFDCECVGGGRIIHDASQKTLNVFGYSQGYGKADHEVTCQILKEKFPDYNINWSNDGY